MRKKKLIVGILIFMLTLIAFALMNTADAASLGKLTITKSRNVGDVTYKHQLYAADENPKNIWKIARSKNNVTITNKADSDYLKDLYCLRAGLGFVSDTTTVEGTTVEYDYSITLSKKNIEETFNQLVQRYSSVTSEVTLFKNQNKDKFYSVLWLLDNMLLEDATEADMTAFLLDQTKGAGYTQAELDQAKFIVSGKNIDVKRSVLTRADIEVIQQLAIWYFTNNDQSAYNKETLPTMWLYAEGDGPFDQFNTGKSNGKDVYKTYADIYNLNFPELPGSTVEIDGQIVNISEISGQWGTKKQNHAITLYRNLITQAKAAGRSVYTPERDMTIYLAGTDFASQQPVIQVEESKGEADISLRKFISAVNGIKIEGENSRVPDVDTSILNTRVGAENYTTAIYNHPKKPVAVKIGDTVTYTIRLYNEGEIDTYIEEVKDYLPTYLSRVIPEDKSETETYWTPSEEDNERGYIYRTTENCRIVGAGGQLNYNSLQGKKLSEVLIPAAKWNENFSSEKDVYTLSYVDIEIDCKVMNNAPYGEAITNIAEVSIMKDKDRRDLEDRDSSVKNVKVQPGNDLPNEQLDGPLPNYKADELEKKYVPGQEDDDDFDKVIVEKPIIDLALRKFISKIGDQNYNRVPTVDTTPLRTGGDTARYVHSKEPIEAYIGDVVKYKIRVYNEGEVDGKVTEITDYISSNLKYVPNPDKTGNDADGDWWKSSAGDKAGHNKVVTTNKCKITGAGGKLTNSSIGKTLDEVIIPAYDKNTDTISYIEVEIHCQIMPVKSTIKMTNIAEITKEKDENDRPVEKDKDSTPGNVKVPDEKDLPGYKDPESDKPYVPGQEDDDDFEKVLVLVPEIDLSLRKFITEVDGTKREGDYSRVPRVVTTNLDTHKDTTAEYNHSKVPVNVKPGSEVIYTIRLYNEGEIDSYVTEVTDYLPNYLKYLPDHPINQKYDWAYNTTTREAKTTITSDENTNGIETYKDRPNGRLIKAYDGKGELDYIDVEIACQVDENVDTKQILTNLSQITGMKDVKGNVIEEDRDSKPDGDKDPNKDFEIPNDNDRPNYKKDEEGKPYVPGQEDDDDFEKVLVLVPEVDLSLRKFITEVDGNIREGEESRVPEVKTDTLDDLKDTTAQYIHSKVPVNVRKGSEVVYTIRLYNEGEKNAYVSKVTDYLPNYLMYLPENEINKKYGWSYDEATREVKTTITAEENQKGDELYKDRPNGKLLKAYDGNGELDYIDVQIVCKVDTKVVGNTILTNLAQITEVKDEKGNIVEEDRDSKPDGDKDPNKDFEIPSEKDRPNYKKDEEGKPYVPGQEDDDDFEKVIVKPDFDLALRKFITQVETTPINNRYPEVSYENGKISYKHPKDPVELATGNTVIYTIRIFNEGQANGYANEITDDMPEGLVFLPEHEINKEYRWIMLDENQEETDDTSKAKYIVTDYLSEEQQKETGRNNEIKAFRPEEAISNTNPDYRDVKLAFKVTHVAKTIEDSKKILKNVAQISKDSDDDIDSEPNRDTPYDPDGDNEDDIDYDNVRVKYFDLALLKWVSQTKVTHKGGEEIVTDTGHTAETSKNEAPVKIEIPEKELKTITIKYVYTIRIENQGEIEGYATEVKDYIPAGLKFNEEDNKEWRWKVLEDGVVVTDYLKDTLLKPGETATVPIVLTWINDANNLGEKVNLAEISKDKNDSDSPDVDSTPDNKVPGEDDIDDAPVILAVKTGAAKLYLGLTAIILITFSLGTGLIKKYVLE